VAPSETLVDAGQVRIDVAALSLPGLTDAEYTVTVTNGADGGGDVVWTRALSSTSYGDGAGSLSYVGTCDASDDGVSTVTVALDALRTAGGILDPATYRNPGALSKEVVCLANADVAVTFDLTIVRQAQQGFFDVAVSFEDIFCSAKLDCVNDAGGDLELLHDPDTGARDLTAVLGFACTGAPSGTTWLYMDDLVISCTGLTLDVRVDPTGRGNLDTTAAPNVNADGYLFAASVFRGVEGLAAKAYWNVSLGLDETMFEDAGDCTLTGRATASSEPFPQEIDGFPLPEGSVYPVIDWSVQLSDADGRVCEADAVNEDGSGVQTRYFTWADAPIHLDTRYEPQADVALRAAVATCNPTCAHGACVATDTCDCTGTGYTGATCATDVDECAAGSDDCGAGEACVNTDGGFTCVSFSTCLTLLAEGNTTSGVYEVDPDGPGGNPAFDAWCDMTADGGGWTRVFLGANNSYSDALTYETGTAPIIGGSTEMMFAYTNTVSYGLSQAWKFPTPAVFVSTTPMAGVDCGYESIDATRLSDGHTTTQLLRYGWGSFSDECDEECRNSWGQVCLKNNTTLAAAGGYLDFPMYTGFYYSGGDWCASSSGLYSAASCVDTRRFSILVR